MKTRNIDKSLWNKAIPVIQQYFNLGWSTGWTWEQLTQSLCHSIGRISAQDLLCARYAGKELRRVYQNTGAAKDKTGTWSEVDVRKILETLLDSMDDSESILAQENDRQEKKAKADAVRAATKASIEGTAGTGNIDFSNLIIK